eukprot:GILK01001968.1.p1 GENE.GILK01001968.1~~GILK01001968.1.p1  ORF type:complete len:207 (+),score=23.10 GILK01001968.1:124-744(+)
MTEASAPVSTSSQDGFLASSSDSQTVAESLAPAPLQRQNSNNGNGMNGGLPKPALGRSASTSTGFRPIPANQTFDWRTFLTIEERTATRLKIKDAYSKTCSSYEDLLDTVVAIEEELLHILSQGRLEYLKAGLEWEGRVQMKRRQLSGQFPLAKSSAAVPATGSPTLPPNGVKRPADSDLPTPSKKPREESKLNPAKAVEVVKKAS